MKIDLVNHSGNPSNRHRLSQWMTNSLLFIKLPAHNLPPSRQIVQEVERLSGFAPQRISAISPRAMETAKTVGRGYRVSD